MEIKIKSISLDYFKGIREKTIEFDPESTNLSGDNGTGKTTILDAFLWLLFDKDSSGRTDFGIKTLNKSGTPLSQVEHCVTGVILVDGEQLTLRKTYREKWVKKRGSSIAEFGGHERDHFINDAPMAQKDYQSTIKDICEETLFRLITTPTYFPSLHWKDAREILFTMADAPEEMELLQSDARFKKLAELTGKYKNVEGLKIEIMSKKKHLKDEIEKITPRIDEVEHGKPAPVNEAEIKAQINDLNAQVQKIDTEIEDISKAMETELKAKVELQQQVYQLKQNRDKLLQDARQKINESLSFNNQLIRELTAKKQAIESEIAGYTRQINSNQTQVEKFTEKISKLREQWKSENEKELTFSEHIFSCPTCKRAYDTDDIDAKQLELTENFNRAKLEKLEEINKQGVSVKKELASYTIEIDNLTEKIEALKADLLKIEIPAKTVAFEPDVDKVEGYREITEQILILEDELSERPAAPDTATLKARKSEFNTQIDQLKKQLNNQEIINKADARISELMSQQQQYAEDLSNYEGIEALIQDFTRFKVDMIEKRVNGLFEFVRFKLFDTQVNGQIVETCTPTVDGVPYSDLNNAMRINAGIDIINALSKYHNAFAPIWIDNRESVNKIPETKSQVINLIVSWLPELTVVEHINPVTEIEFEEQKK